MSSAHKRSPLSVRLPEGDQAWLADHAVKAGKAVNAVVVAAILEYRERHDGTTAAAIPPEGGKTTRARKPRAAPTATFRQPEQAPACKPEAGAPEGASDIAAFFRRRNEGDQR
jgi:hypothetical protein